jgi:hypothetical protein
VNVSGLLHLFRALHAEADLSDLADHIGLAELLFNHLDQEITFFKSKLSFILFANHFIIL